MTQPTPPFTLGQAAELVGRSKSTLSRAIERGTLTANRDSPDSPYKIDAAELFRVYPPVAATGGATPESNDTQPRDATGATPENASNEKALSREIELLREMMEGKDDEIRDLRRRLDVEGEERRKLTAMITYEQAKPATAPQETPQARRSRWWPFGKANS